MTEYITEWFWDEMRNAPNQVQREEIVRCRDCKYGIDGGEYCAEDCADSWDWRCVEPDGFCAWAEKRDK